jgi:secretion/DNA translocation related TadE-like protein
VLVGLLGVVAAVVAVVGGAVADQRRAASAADLAALAGAQAVQHGGDGCRAADAVARRNGASVASCRLEGEVVVLRVTGPARSFLGRRVRAASSARAGPVP